MHKNNVSESFFRFNRLSQTEKVELLKKTGILMDTDEDGDNTVKLYFLYGFFVEMILCRHSKALIELIPYKNGYRVYNFLLN